MTPPEWTPAPHRVVVEPPTVLAMLRAMVGSPLLAPLPDEHAATMGRPWSEAMTIDAGAWVSWCLAGLHVCERFGIENEPDTAASWLDVIGEAVKRLMLVMVMRRTGGDLTRAAKGLRVPRRWLRERLRSMGLHPWPAESSPQQRPAASDEHASGAANGPGALAIVNALAGILERAEALRSDGHDTHDAIVRAVKEHQASQALACVAFAAWMLAVTPDGEASS